MTARKRKARRGAVARPINLAREAKAIHRDYKLMEAKGKEFVDLAVAVGQRLQRCKDEVGHGNWLQWQKANCRFSHDKASLLMALYGLSQHPKFRTLRNMLPLTGLYHLATQPAEVIEETAQKLESGELTRYLTVKTTIERRTVDVPSYLQQSTTKQPEAPDVEHADQEPEQDQDPELDQEEQEPASAAEQPPPAALPAPSQLVAPAEATNGNAAAAEPQAAPPPSDDDAAAAAYFAALADHPPPDNAHALLAAFHEQTRLSVERFKKYVHILAQLQWLLRDEATPPKGGRAH